MGLEATINSALVKLEEWAKLNGMTVNTTKTTYQLFSLSTRRPTVNLRYCGSELEEVNMSKYLGVNIDTRMTWKHHIEPVSYTHLDVYKRQILYSKISKTSLDANFVRKT